MLTIGSRTVMRGAMWRRNIGWLVIKRSLGSNELSGGINNRNRRAENIGGGENIEGEINGNRRLYLAMWRKSMIMKYNQWRMKIAAMARRYLAAKIISWRKASSSNHSRIAHRTALHAPLHLTPHAPRCALHAPHTAPHTHRASPLHSLCRLRSAAIVSSRRATI